jgi:hypothetical protein
MTGMIEIAQQNLLSPMVLFFALGLFASFVRSDLNIPEAIAKTMAIYLMMAIGFKGGVELAKAGASVTLFLVLGAGALVSAVLPLIGFALLSATSPCRASTVQRLRHITARSPLSRSLQPRRRLPQPGSTMTAT